MTLIIFYLIALTISLNVVVTLFYSNITAHLTNFLFGLKEEERLFTREDFEDFARAEFPFVASDFLSCKLCISHWVSLVVGGIVGGITGFWTLPLLAMFSFPVIIFTIDKILLHK
jgi:hypothetical protein